MKAPLFFPSKSWRHGGHSNAFHLAGH